MTQILAIAFFAIGAQLAITNAADRFWMSAKNQYLRFYVFEKKTSIKTCIFATNEYVNTQTRRLYQSILSKYNDVNILYYSLPESDRELIEQIINLHF